MTSATLVFPSKLVQAFDHKCVFKEWQVGKCLTQRAESFALIASKSGGNIQGKWQIRVLDKRHNGGLPERGCGWIAAVAAETDVALEESDPALATQNDLLEFLANAGSRHASETLDKLRYADVQEQASSAPRRSLKNEELQPGAVFLGKVRSIHSFGAFVDIGAFTDGLVHVSQLCEGYVNATQDVVSVGQEVKVRILHVNIQAGRIALTMKEKDEAKEQRESTGKADEGSEGGGRGRFISGAFRNRKPDEKKKSKLEKGQSVHAVVKSLVRRGAFVTLPGGEEGFLPVYEIPNGETTPLEKLLKPGKHIEARVIRVAGTRITLSVKPVLDLASINKKVNEGVDIVGANQFELAFRSNPVIGKYLSQLGEKREPEAESDEPAAVVLRPNKEPAPTEESEVCRGDDMEKKAEQDNATFAKEKELSSINEGELSGIDHVSTSRKAKDLATDGSSIFPIRAEEV
ncbi:hypothetical protein O6H91_17G030900 [Diphasiastrum complanatum]|uniref:Uncharacterized protein n=1 Tax=Diphasiastrum complanatum TaxID=34168 RepID=A0ACC2B5G0_DIPCM|nr:hypothetical protein O6H91_17G030900 [Diphasiastrum complanatum]